LPGLPCFRRETKKEKLSSGAATECRILSVIGLLGGLSAHRFDGRTAINDFGGSRRRRPRVQPGRPPGIRVKLALRGRVQGGPQRREACYPDVRQPGYNMSASDGLKIATDLSLRSRKKRSSPFLVLAAVLLIFAAIAGTAFLVVRTTTLRIAVGPSGSDDQKLIQAMRGGRLLPRNARLL
jgi:hypothetical protein